jgi:hypothetical protein
VVSVTGDLLAGTRIALGCAHALKNRAPQKDLRNDRQKPHQRAEPEVAPVDEPLLDANAKDRPPGLNAGKHAGS